MFTSSRMEFRDLHVPSTRIYLLIMLIDIFFQMHLISYLVKSTFSRKKKSF